LQTDNTPTYTGNMFRILAGIIGSIINIGTGLVGIRSDIPGLPQSNVTVAQTVVNACYNPQPDVKLTLTWPYNFFNLTDKRVSLNPSIFKNNHPVFNSENACYEMVLKDTDGNQLNSRNYILVRSDVRISSCKTDELAGPYNIDGVSCPDGSIDAAKIHRGNCTIDGYSELRKVAEIPQVGLEPLEIFWVPFSHNVGCNYEQNNNCGPGDRTNANLREFIYVLKKRDAYDPNQSANCKVLWDAGSTNKDACSHYFDVYMAEDLYAKLQGDVVPEDPDYGTYQFYKSAIENCQEQNTVIPIGDTTDFSFPPNFIDKPFVASDFFQKILGKITPSSDKELKNYQYFVNSNLSINPFITSLIQFGQSDETINICNLQTASVNTNSIAKLASEPSCYAVLGNVVFQKDSNQFVGFDVYSRYDTPQTFYLRPNSGDIKKIYKYTITEQKPVSSTSKEGGVQLGTIEFETQNTWTWATPWCKPAIYLYPEKETELNVKLRLDGRLTMSNPPYDSITGWNVIASPDGRIQQLTTHNPQLITSFPYLYYEANLNNIEIPKEGYVVEKEKLEIFLTKLLSDIGFNSQETGDFNKYWLPRLTEKPYYFITLLPEELINAKEALSFSVKPETIIRTRVVFEGLYVPIRVRPLTPLRSDPVKRQGFTVTDWGGTLVGKDCSNLEIK